MSSSPYSWQRWAAAGVSATLAMGAAGAWLALRGATEGDTVAVIDPPSYG